MGELERVAQAIHEAECEWASTPGKPWDECREVTRDMRRACARAALEAADRGAVSLAEVCEYLRTATHEDPRTGGDRHPHGYRAAAADLERHFGGQ